MILASLILALPCQQPLIQQHDPGPDLLSDVTYRLPQLGTEVREIRWFDTASGTIARRATLPDGTVVDADGLRREDRRLANLARGKISHELLDQMAQAQSGELLEVVFWLDASDSPDFRQILVSAEKAGMTGEEARRYARDQAQLFFAERNRTFATALSAAEFQVTEVAGPWPLVFAKLPVESIPEWAARPEVDQTYYSFPKWESELDDAQGTMRTPIIWDGGLTAAGSPVKTMVNDTADVTGSNPYLPPIIELTNIGTGSHASSVAGNICMNHSTYKAAAYGIPQLYSGGGSGDTAAPNVWNLAITAGVSFGNCSWWNFNKGSIVFLDRFFDYTLRNFAMMMFKSTGNQGNTSTPYTTSPGNGYNSTNSGAYNDQNNSNWSGDFMASYSSYWDPVEGHEKPELANAGDDVTTTSTTGITSGFNGTSSASPLTCGVATLMATRDNSLMTNPECIKGVLMASAWHNIEGDPVLSEKDGAGGVHALAADNVVKNGQFQTGTLTPASFDPFTNSFDVTFQTAAGLETRVCALWFSNANAAYTTDMLDMDLDLSILDPQGNSVAQSASALNPFEILSFVPAQSGTYTARLVNQRFDGTSETYCLAWSTKLDMAEGRINVVGTPSVGSSITIDLDANYQPNDWYELRVSNKTLPSTTVVGSNFVLALAMDNVWNWSAGQPGFAGSLNSSSQASVTANIPNNSNLIGRTVHLGFYTKPSSGSSTVDTVSETAPLTIVP